MNKDSLCDKEILKQNLNFFYDIISCNHNINHWIYAEDGHLVNSNSPDERILDVLFSVGANKEYLLQYGKEHSMPLVLSSSLGNLWIAVIEKKEDLLHFHVLGPAFTDPISPANLQSRVKKYNIPLDWQQEFSRIVRDFPVIPWTSLAQYTIMLHYVVNNERITISDFAYQTEFSASAQELQDSENTDGKNLPWMAEQSLLYNIREGNLNYQDALANASHVSTGVGIDVGDPLRRAKDSGIVFCALCARAAIEGGLSTTTAYSLQNRYTESLEAAAQVSEIAAVNHQMYEDYILRVHKLKNLHDVSPAVQKCMDFIEINIREKITMQSLAADCGYTEYYLSRKFKKETGKSINDYIAECKILAAKKLLISTTLTIQEISDEFNFCSRSYFTETFKKLVHMSPTGYRREKQRL